MATQHNMFIRKFGDKAIVITVTDWDDFKELEKFSKQSDPDFLLSAVTSKSIYTNMMPSMQIDPSSAIDITQGTKGSGLAGIITGGCNSPGSKGQFKKFIGGFWSIRKIKGLMFDGEEDKPTIKG